MKPIADTENRSSAKKSHGRYAFLDALRAIAALAVLFQHVLPRVSPGFRFIAAHYFNPGIFGVGLFFLVSGFIIPVSLERKKSLKKFWITRLFRIYPLFIFSLTVTLFIIYFQNPLRLPSLQTVVLQVLFLLHFITGKSIVYLYWTLGLEILFYVLVSAAYYFGYIKKSVLLACIMLGISFIAGSILLGLMHIGAGSGLIFYLASMFTGTLYYRYLNGEIKLKTLILVISLTVVVFLSNSILVLSDATHSGFGNKDLIAVISSTLLAYLVFSVAFYFRDKKFPAFIIYLGVISYSIYLIQNTVLMLLPKLTNVYLYATLLIVLTLAVSAITNLLIEKPFIKWGHKLTEKVN